MTTHHTFTVTRVFEHPRSAVFGLFADDAVWRRWFRMPGSAATYAHDFSVGGRDRATSEFRMPDGRIEHLENNATYLAIDERRVVYAYEARVDDIPRWASLVTVELRDVAGGTEMTWTEQVAVLHPSPEEQDLAHLRGSIQLRFNAMALALAAEVTSV